MAYSLLPFLLGIREKKGFVRFGGFMKKGIRGLVTSVIRVSPHLIRISFRLSQGLRYFPGQSVWMYRAEQNDAGSLEPCFQLCGCPELAYRTNHYEVLAETAFYRDSVRGLGRVKMGDLIQVKGPFGQFWPLAARPETNVVWIATPQLLGPYLACVQSRNFEKVRPRKIVLLIEVKTEQEIPERKLFESKGVTVIPCITQPQNWVDGFWGRLIDLIKSDRFKLPFHDARFFVSTDPQLSGELWNCLVYEKGVNPAQITEESVSSSQEVSGKFLGFFKAA